MTALFRVPKLLKNRLLQTAMEYEYGDIASRCKKRISALTVRRMVILFLNSTYCLFKIKVLSTGKGNSKCFFHLPSYEKSKPSHQVAIFVFLGYGDGEKGFLCFDPIARRIRISRNVAFLDNVYI